MNCRIASRSLESSVVKIRIEPNRRDKLFKNGVKKLTDSELVALENTNNITESTEMKLDEIIESIRKIRNDV